MCLVDPMSMTKAAHVTRKVNGALLIQQLARKEGI